MIDFKHEYFLPNEKKTLCMKCGKVIYQPGMSTAQVMDNYNEIQITWDIDGKDTPGVLIVCKDCRDYKLEKKHKADIHKQIINAFGRDFALRKKESDFPGFKSKFENHAIKGGI